MQTRFGRDRYFPAVTDLVDTISKGLRPFVVYD
jgi:hypothetical protein